MSRDFLEGFFGGGRAKNAQELTTDGGEGGVISIQYSVFNNEKGKRNVYTKVTKQTKGMKADGENHRWTRMDTDGGEAEESVFSIQQ